MHINIVNLRNNKKSYPSYVGAEKSSFPFKNIHIANQQADRQKFYRKILITNSGDESTPKMSNLYLKQQSIKPFHNIFISAQNLYNSLSTWLTHSRIFRIIE